MTDYVYDIETYPNVFTLAIGNVATRKCKVFEISNRNDHREQMFEHLRMICKTNGRMVGFNNVGFDYPVIHHLLKNKTLSVNEIYNYAMRVINSESKFEFIVKDKDVFIEQIDLYKIHHFDNKNRATSLKMLEFNMRSENIEDLPFPVGKWLTDEEIDVLIKYNKHDMLQTFLFYNESKEQIEFREKLSKKYNKNFMNFNDTKIGKDYFIMKLEEEMPGCCYKKGKIQQTIRPFIDIKDCIFDYIKFERPEFNAVLDWFRRQRITETKGVFSNILESDLFDVAKYANMVTKRKKLKDKPTEDDINELKKQYPMCWFEEVELKSKKISYYICWNVAETLNVVINGFQYDFGTGGIHGSIESTIVVSDEEYEIEDRDVASFYPNLAIKNRIFPEHLSESFCDIYEDVYNQRKSYGKGTAENAMMKLALNGTYGASNDTYSPFYDPKFTISITVNGQLSLCMVAEQLLKLDGLEMIQVNTDGLTFKRKKEHNDIVHSICSKWEQDTKLELEKVIYSKMIIRDVNSYIAVKMDGSLKNKGAFQWQGLGWHQNHSAPVIAMAAEKVLVNNEDLEYVIKNHDNHMDFMLRTKVPRSSRLVTIDEFGSDVQQQNICRYYISDEGQQLVKIMPPIEKYKMMKTYVDNQGENHYPKNKTEENKCIKAGYYFIGETNVEQPERRFRINNGYNVQICNDIKMYNGSINYQYYMDEAMKLISLCKTEDEEESTSD